MAFIRVPRHLSALAPLFLLAIISLFSFRLYSKYARTLQIPTTPPLPISTSWNRTKPLSAYSRTLVMARLKSDDISWVDRQLPTLNRSIYTVDDPTSTPSIPANKGHEAMVYLTYIIDNYHALPDTVLFFHPHQSAWHNNILLNLDTAVTISRLSYARVARDGYFNARCHLDPGCPDWLHLDRPEAEWDPVKKAEERYFTPAVWEELHPGAPPPRALSQPCCAQFAVSRERILSHPRSSYLRWRQWLLDTPIPDEFSGRIMEYTWQYIFTGQAEFCPPQHECYCDGYGICFGSEKRLQGWLKILREREVIDDKIAAYKGQATDWDFRQLQAEQRELKARLAIGKNEAYRRGDDPKNRAAEAGRAWREGDGF